MGKKQFVTFQPISTLNSIENKGICLGSDGNRLNNKIYCLALNEFTMERLFICAPSMPQVMIIFETDKFEEIDSIAWVNRLFLGKETLSTSKYKEYTVDSIKNTDVIKTRIISDSKDPDEVQDKFVNTHYGSIAKLSGKKWYRLGDIPNFWNKPHAFMVVEKITSCMIPHKEITEENYDEAIELVRKYFIRE